MNAESVAMTMISRRRFLKDAGRCFLGTALLSSGLALQPFSSKAFASVHGDKPMDYLKYATFSELIGETFTLRMGDSETMTVKLVEAIERKGGMPKNDQHPQQECFSILFQGPRETHLPQGTYHFHHHRTRDFALFIVPVSVDDQGCHYEAVINRLCA